jgi:phage-related protein
MATFPDIKPLYQLPVSKTFRILRNDFGDGYSQRAADGLNYELNDFIYDVIVNQTDATTIIDFLDARGGYEAFDYTLPRETTAKKFSCKQYTRTPIGPSTDQIQATFTQEYDLD